MTKQTSKIKTQLAMAFTLLFLAGTALTGCDRDEGGMEEMGENMDETMTDVGNAIEDACEDAKTEAGAEDTNC